MNKVLYKSLVKYFEANIDRHRVNIILHTGKPVGVAEHSDHTETIEKELGKISEYEDKLSVLKKYFGTDEKEVLNG